MVEDVQNMIIQSDLSRERSKIVAVLNAQVQEGDNSEAVVVVIKFYEITSHLLQLARS